jgi:toxin ParE1/3/4
MAAKRRQVQLTPLAETDLEEIWPYTSQRWSLKQAEHYHHDLVETLETLARDDKIGRPCAARLSALSGWIARDVLPRNRQHPGRIRVPHQRMDVE